MQPIFGGLSGVLEWKPMAIHILSARSVQTAAPGDHSDGGGLFLHVGQNGVSWFFRYTGPDGRRREMGLGGVERATLATCGNALTQVRRDCERQRALLAQGIDPIDKRKADKNNARAEAQRIKEAEIAQRTTLARVARRYHEQVIEPSRTTKHAAQWIASVEQNVPRNLWNSPIDQITPAQLLEALAGVQLRVPETASRVRQRLEKIFDDAIFHELCTLNPAKIIRHKLAERPSGQSAGPFKALPFPEVPLFMQRLREHLGTAARALEFAILCAARTDEVLKCTADEIEEQTGIWRVPGKRMKGREDHTVFLSPRAMEIVMQMKQLNGTYLFPSPMNQEKPMSNMAMLTVLKRMKYSDQTTVHGICRASFSTWANDLGIARPDVIEAALAHREQDKVRRSYNRAQFNVERRNLLLAWAAYCNGEEVQASGTTTLLPANSFTLRAVA
jgi:integrase